MKKNSLPIVRIRELEKHALEMYVECPKYTTIVRHADLVDDSVFHCFTTFIGPPLPGTYPFQRNFTVPKQEVWLVEDAEYGLFSVIRVFEKPESPECWLVTSIRNRMGFLLPFEHLRLEDLMPVTYVPALQQVVSSRTWTADVVPNYA
jgi:hypothetical protein